MYGSTLPVNENHVCAGGQRGNDACTGFGGAPLLVRHGEFFYQVKLTLLFNYYMYKGDTEGRIVTDEFHDFQMSMPSSA